jgi:diguanylate cyclase (GGDEF)-like protein
MRWKATIDGIALAALIFAVVAIVAVSTVAVISAESLISTNEKILRAQRLISSLEAIRYHSLALDAGEQNFIITGNPRDLGPYHAGIAELEAELSYLADKNDDAPYLEGNFAELATTVRALIIKEREIVDVRRRQGFAAAQALTQRHVADTLHERLIGVSYRMLIATRRGLDKLEAEQIAFGDKVRRLILALILSSAFILVFLYGTLRRLNIEQREAQERMAHQATHDELTGLFNRPAVMEYLDEKLADDDTPALGGLAVLLLDLDGFKSVNDSQGHDAGDLLLKQVASRLVHALRDSDYIARLGGDEFLVVIPQVSDRETAARVAEKLIAAIARPYSLGEQDARITTSIGISLFPEDGRDREVLMKGADLALYQAKDEGRNKARFFEPGMHGGSRP